MTGVQLLHHQDDFSFATKAQIIASSQSLIVFFFRVFVAAGLVGLIFELTRRIVRRRSEAKEEQQIATGI
jgi:hypothetical protein